MLHNSWKGQRSLSFSGMFRRSSLETFYHPSHLQRSVFKLAGLPCCGRNVNSSDTVGTHFIGPWCSPAILTLRFWTNWIAVFSYTALSSWRPLAHMSHLNGFTVTMWTPPYVQRWLGSAFTFVTFRNIVPAVSVELLRLLEVPLKETSLPQTPDESSQDHHTQN